MAMEMVRLVTPQCGVCGRTGIVEVPALGCIRRLRDGATVQDAFPELPRALREQIVTGTHPACWDELFDDAADAVADEPEGDCVDDDERSYGPQVRRRARLQRQADAADSDDGERPDRNPA